MNNYELALAFLNNEAKKNNEEELYLPKEDRVHFYVKGNGVDTIDSIIFSLGIFDIECDSIFNGVIKIKSGDDGRLFLKRLKSIEIFPEESDEVDISEDMLHIKVKTS